MEIWKDIEGYPNYQISNLGNVKNVKTDKLLKGSINNLGYPYVYLRKDGKPKIKTIHRLVAEAFLPNPDNLPIINHKNENKADNRVENLEWCNYTYNNNYGDRNNKTAKALSKSVLQFTLNGDFVKKWESIAEIRKEKGFEVSGCCKGKYKTSHNFKWGYADDYEKIKFNVFNLELYRKKVS